MFNLAVDFFMLFSNMHFTAAIVGAIVYGGYTMLPTLKLMVQSFVQSREVADPKAVFQRQIKLTPRNLAGAGAILFLLIGLGLTAYNPFLEPVDATCPSWDLDSSYLMAPPSDVVRSAPAAPAAVSETDPPAATTAEQLRAKFMGGKFKGGRGARASIPQADAEPPTVLLAKAQQAVDASSDTSASWPLLEACAAWKPTEGAVADATELQAQLECNGELLESGATTMEASPGLLARSRQLMTSLRTATPATEKADVEWSRIMHNVFQLNCKAATDELQMSRKAKAGQKPTVATPLEALRSLKRLEEPLRETLAALTHGVKLLEARALDDTKVAEEVQELRKALGADRACALQALQEGRSVANALPKSSPMVKKAMQCKPRMLEDFQAFILQEATEAKDAANIFGLGLYYSDAGLATESGKQQVPFFGTAANSRVSFKKFSWSSEPIWAADAGGSHAPTDLVKAEELMLAGEEASAEADKGDRGAARSLRLYQHAKMLALKHHDSAAEWRYRAAAELAASHRRQKLAAHALGRLAYFLSLRGRKEEALEAAGIALTHGEEDPLAQFLQVSLKRSLGELKTDEEVLAAEKQLGTVAGKMPSKTLENERSAAHAEFGWWRLVATEGLQVCLKAWDAAQMLICLFSGMMFQLPEVAAP